MWLHFRAYKSVKPITAKIIGIIIVHCIWKWNSQWKHKDHTETDYCSEKIETKNYPKWHKYGYNMLVLKRGWFLTYSHIFPHHRSFSTPWIHVSRPNKNENILHYGIYRESICIFGIFLCVVGLDIHILHWHIQSVSCRNNILHSIMHFPCIVF